MFPDQTSAAPPTYAIRIFAFFFGYFVIGGVAVPFYPVWLDARGLTENEIANCIAIPMIVRVLLTPLAGIFADRAPNRRFAACVFLVISALIFATAWPADGYWALLITTGGAFVLWGLALPVAEALALTGVRRFGLDYGRMRLSGSIAFILANLGSGAVLGLVDNEAIFWLLLGALVISSVVAFLLPVTPRAIRALDDAEKPEQPSAWSVLAHPGFLALMLVGGLTQASHGVMYSFGSIYWQTVGFDAVQIGALWAIGVICEILLFAWSGAAIRAFGPFGLLALGTIAAVGRWLIFPVGLGFAGFMVLQVLHGLTFGATYLGTQHAIAQAIPEEMTASAQGIFLMISGLLLALTTIAAGPLYAGYGVDAFYFMVVPPLLALATLAAYRYLTGIPSRS
jgi:PPP family 3-phenylpropionic acid transporter